MPSASSKIMDKIKKMAMDQVIYVDGHIYRFNRTKFDVKNDAVFSFEMMSTNTSPNVKGSESANLVESGRRVSAKIAVLSRNCYKEQLQWYPISKKSDVVKLVKLQINAASSQVLFIVGKAVNGNTPVIYYYLNEFTCGLRAWLLVPETSLLGLAQPADSLLSYQTINPCNTVFVSTSRLAGTVSALQGGMIQNLDQFALSQGVNTQSKAHFSAEEHIQTLQEQLQYLYQLPLTGFVNKLAFSLNTGITTLSHFALPMVAVITLYLVLAVQVSEFKADSVNKKLRAATKNANFVLNQYQDINEMIGRYLQLADNTPENIQLLDVWHVLAPMFESGVMIDNVQQQGQTVTLRLRADSASQALQLLIKQGGVTNAKFVGSVRRQRNMDAASIQFELKSVIPLNGESETIIGYQQNNPSLGPK